MKWLEPEVHHALLAMVVKEWHRLVPGHVHKLGKTKMQKLVYFLKASGVPLPFDFDIHYYGPYSQELAEEMDWLEVLGLVDSARDGNVGVDYRPGDAMEEAMSRYREYLEKHSAAIRRTIEVFKDMSVRDLELHATVHFVRKSGGRTRSVEETLDGVKSLKGDRFREDEIRGAIRYLEANGFS